MFSFSLVSPERKLLTDVEVEELIVPGERGQLDILPGHAPLVTLLQPGMVCYRPKGQQKMKRAVVSWGYCEVGPDGVLLLAETCENATDIDVQRAEHALSSSLKKLDGADLTELDQIRLRKKIIRAQTRLECVKSHSGPTGGSTNH